MTARYFKSIFFLFLLLFLSISGDRQHVIHAQTPNLEIYVANESDQCSGKNQCFFDNDPDTIEAVALHKAISFAKDNGLEYANIHILAPYTIKTDQVVIDYPVNMIGENDGWLSTSSSNCDQPMFLIQAEVVFQNLHITDGSCSNPSRDLIHVESPTEFRIENSTLEYGKNAIVHKTSRGNLSVLFSEIKNNDQYAVLSENTEVTSGLKIVASNLIDNQDPIQVICNSNSSIDHNFWGPDTLPSQASQGCGPDNSKALGAKINSLQTGVAATLLELNSSYPATSFFGLTAKSNQDSKIFVVNHGDLMPFGDRSARGLTACGNYFDVFLAENAEPQEISLRLSYDKNSACTQAIQTMSICGSGNPQYFPLMWLDPKTGVTDGWDYAGDSPQTEAGTIFAGQQVTCDLESKQIEIVLDNDGRPNLLNDLNYTPLVVGFEISAISSFKLNEGTPGKVTISWSSSSETNTSGFRVLRSDSEDGPWTQISTLINSEGGELQNHSYAITDDSIDASTTYYYKLEVLFEDGSLQQSIGPAKIDTLAPTSTPIPSSTPYPTRTTRPTSTTVPTRTPTPFLTATNSYRTFTPTSVTNTPEFTPAVEITDTPTLAEFEKPTSLRPTETTRPTSDAGNLLEKRKDSNPENRNYLLPISLLIIVVGTLSAYFISKKTRNF